MHPPKEYVDSPAFSSLVSLQQCLCEEIAKRNLPEVCMCSVLPGDSVALDYAEQGQAWVRLVMGYPTTTFPDQDQTLSNCGRPLAYQIEMGLMRCAPMLAEDGTPPDAQEQFEATRLQWADMEAMRQAIRCCYPDDAVLSQYTPYGPEGGLVGGTWTLYIGEV